ncbi:MAG: nucleotide exchange factor GrpE [Patescibacteria group bacterium]
MDKQSEQKSSFAKASEDKKEDHDSVEFWKAKAEEHLNGWKRAKADYLNLKKDAQKEKEDLIKFSNAALVIEILPIYDHLKLAFYHLPKELENSNWVKGISGIKKQTQDFLESLGIKEIKTIGEKFDPNFHEAVVHEKKEGFKTDIIFEEIKPGYMMEGKVLYPAKVKVAK